MINKFISKRKKEILILGVFLFVLFIFFIGSAFAALTPTKSIIITSKNTSYENKEEGAWQVEKSGKWIKKNQAQITFDVSTIQKKNKQNTDIILLIDTSGSMVGEKMKKLKSNTLELIESLLLNKNNKVAIITFSSSSTILTDFTNDKDFLKEKINGIEGKEIQIIIRHYKMSIDF